MPVPMGSPYTTSFIDALILLFLCHLLNVSVIVLTNLYLLHLKRTISLILSLLPLKILAVSGKL